MSTECSICLALLPPSEAATPPACAHAFHGTCLSRWLEHGSGCPLCRSKTGDDRAVWTLEVRPDGTIYYRHGAAGESAEEEEGWGPLSAPALIQPGVSWDERAAQLYPYVVGAEGRREVAETLAGMALVQSAIARLPSMSPATADIAVDLLG